MRSNLLLERREYWSCRDGWSRADSFVAGRWSCSWTLDGSSIGCLVMTTFVTLSPFQIAKLRCVITQWNVLVAARHARQLMIIYSGWKWRGGVGGEVSEGKRSVWLFCIRSVSPSSRGKFGKLVIIFWLFAICNTLANVKRREVGVGKRFRLGSSPVAWALMIHSELKLKRVPGFPLVPPWAVGWLFYLMGLLCSTACGSKVTVNGTRYRIIKGIGEGGTYERTPLLSTHRYVKKIQCVWKYTVCGYSAHDPSHRIGTVFNVLVRNTSKMRLQKFQMSHWDIGVSHLTSRCCGWINWLLDLHSSTCHYGFPNSKPELH